MDPAEKMDVDIPAKEVGRSLIFKNQGEIVNVTVTQVSLPNTAFCSAPCMSYVHEVRVLTQRR